MIKHIHIENFKCFKDFDLDLGPFNVLVGPNDSGKTAFLQAVRILGVDLSRNTRSLPVELGLGRDWRDLRREGANEKPWVVRAEFTRKRQSESFVQDRFFDSGSLASKTHHLNEMPAKPSGTQQGDAEPIPGVSVGRVEYYSLNASSCRKPSNLGDRLEPDGSGLCGEVDGLRRDYPSQYAKLRLLFSKRFPFYSEIQSPVEHSHGERGKRLGLAFLTRDGVSIHSSCVSDGVMLTLAVAAICSRTPDLDILLLEEPENGVHPQGLRETIEMLRPLASDLDVQLILTTHSPYLLDLVEPEEVKVFHKKADGSVEAKAMSDYEEVQVMKKHFMTGTIWTELGEERIMEGAKGE
ncbi:MAG: AAA family ATPase [Phycisphaerae bacterium]